MKVNGEAIYETRPVAPYKEAKTCFTSLADGTVYAIYLADEDETAPPATIMLTSIAPPSRGRSSGCSASGRASAGRRSARALS